MGEVWGYARISKDDEKHGIGTARQRADIEAEARRRGLTLAGVLIDNDRSASRYARKPREEYGRLLAGLEDGLCSKVIFWNLDRFQRQPKELEHLIDLAETRPVELLACQGDTDLATPDGRFVARILVAKAAKESDDTSWRVKRALKDRALEGQPGSGVRPYGFEADRVTINETEAAVIREIAGRAARGESLHGLAADLNARGIPSRTGARWSRTTVKTILTSPRVVGLRQHHDATYPAAWPPIITPATQAAIVARFSPRRTYDPSRVTGRRAAPRRHWLLDIVRCGRCEDRTRLGSSCGGGGPAYACRVCTLTINAARVEALVLEVIRPVLRHKEVRSFAAVETSPELDTIRAELVEVNHRLEDLELAMWSRGDIKPEHYELAKTQLRDRESVLTAQLPAPQSHMVGFPWRAAWDELNAVQKRDLAALVIERVVVAPARTTHWDPSRVTVELQPRAAALLL